MKARKQARTSTGKNLQPTPRRSKVVKVWLAKELVEAVTRAAKAMHISRAEFLRVAVRENLGSLKSGELKVPATKGGAR